ncbi:hypothetical protein [Pseudomonas aeruginosa]|uniref:hypothetical protein n=1 Tax=Pseudomonas aeruginosa TaxID=287 RepID=UPI002448851B|nr:hypothetical protein [Pseudomonas aeruginosa]MDH1421370.1 hypothetical protein [Pseudomonas aeruginosa]
MSHERWNTARFEAINWEDNQRGIPIAIKNNLYFRFDYTRKGEGWEVTLWNAEGTIARIEDSPTGFSFSSYRVDLVDAELLAEIHTQLKDQINKVKPTGLIAVGGLKHLSHIVVTEPDAEGTFWEAESRTIRLTIRGETGYLIHYYSAKNEYFETLNDTDWYAVVVNGDSNALIGCIHSGNQVLKYEVMDDILTEEDLVGIGLQIQRFMLRKKGLSRLMIQPNRFQDHEG